MKKIKKRNKKPQKETVSKVLATRQKNTRQDGYYNQTTGFGGANDALNNTNFIRNKWTTQEELDALYDYNWAAKRAIDAPVNDMFSNWITFIESNDNENDQARIEGVEKSFKEFNLKPTLKHAFSQSRLHWGSAIFFDYGDDPETPLFNVTRPPLKIDVVNSWHCIPTTFYSEGIYGSSFPKVGEPEHYTVIIQKAGYQKSMSVHESRLLIVQGLPVSDARISIERRGWGFSVLEAMSDALKGYGIAMQSSADILQNFFWKVLKIKDLADLVADNADDQIIARVAYAVNAMGSQNTGVFADEEELRRESATVTGIPEISDRLGNQLCAAAHPGIPWSVFFSAEGGSLGGTSAESDVKNYYKRVAGMQESDLRPAIERFMYFIGIDSDQFPFLFDNLDEPTRKEDLENRKIAIDGFVALITSEVLLPEEVANSMFQGDKIILDQIILDKALRIEVAKEQEKINEQENDDQKINE
jgi:phage-related protein (TIGR01555 family)